MDLGGEALGAFKAKQGGCTQIQVSLVRLEGVHTSMCFDRLTRVPSSSTKHQDISSKRFFQNVMQSKS